MKTIILLGLITTVLGASNACKGCINLDESSFDKIIPKFDAVLVKFDVSYPYGDKHDLFVQLADELKDLPDLVLAEVGVKDYGDKENEALALKHGFGKDDLPGLKLFRKNPELDPVDFAGEWTLDNLRNFIKDNTDIYIGLPGCLEAFDRLAMVFSHNSDKQSVIKKTEKAAEKLKVANDKDKAQIYVKYMRKIAESATSSSFVANETERLKKLVKDGKMNEKKKQELTYRINILRSFSLPAAKDEL